VSFLRRKHLWLALALVLLVEALLRTPATALLQSGASHTGRSLQLQSALTAIGPENIEVVTLGNSVAEYGIDHVALGLSLRAKGLDYASLAMPGGHLLTLRALTRFARERMTGLRAAVVLISLTEFETVGNGSYEMAIAQPWLRFGDWRWTDEHVPPDLSEPSTLGAYSALAGYRHQFQFLSRHPARLWKAWRWWRWPSVDARLWPTGRGPAGLCGMDTSSVAACLDESRPLDAALTPAETAAVARATCANLLLPGQHQGDWRGHDLEQESPVFKRMREIRQEQVRDLPGKTRPLVVLMPVHPLWERERLAIGVRDWVDQIYGPLAASGEIRWLDLSRIFELPGMQPCTYFGDMYHLNSAGQAVVTGEIEKALGLL
jgi:hypothetical protein